MGPTKLVDSVDADRVLEHTEKSLVGLFRTDSSESSINWEALLKLPVLLMPETQNARVEQVARVGSVSKLRKEAKGYEYTFVPDLEIEPIPTSVIEAHAETFQIDAERWEFSRTHWAVKNVDLYKVLVRLRLVGGDGASANLGGEISGPIRGAEASNEGVPTLFIGSSGEGVAVARALQALLDQALECTVWDQGVFASGASSLTNLISRAKSADYAALILSPDDVVVTRGMVGDTPRDNVIFELGLFMGVLSPERVFMLLPREKPTRLPSDLAGITYLTYQANRSDSNLRAALGPSALDISERAKSLGRR
ncbi:nucleotide-binding protein [Kocuria sp. KSNUG]|uniref:TIR domain-containing protein n=1 Tax=Kocuria sp. KSNUG TaxID=3136676 RepID=UPI003C2C0237